MDVIGSTPRNPAVLYIVILRTCDAETNAGKLSESGCDVDRSRHVEAGETRNVDASEESVREGERSSAQLNKNEMKWAMCIACL